MSKFSIGHISKRVYNDIVGFLYAFATLNYALACFFYFEQRKHIKTNHILMLVFGFTASFGYTAGTWAGDIETYLFTNLLYSLSMLMALLYMVFSVAELCQIKLRNSLKNGLVLTVILQLLFITDPFEWYWYKFSAVLKKYNGFSYAEIEKGPAYYLTVLFILFCFFVIMRVIIRALNTRKQISKKTCWYLIGIALLVFSCYVITQLTNSIYNLVPLCLPIVQNLAILIIRKMSLYDINETFASVFEERREYCYICFDGKLHYVGASKLCLEMFPRLETLRVDEPIPEGRIPELKPITDSLPSWIDDEQEHIIDIPREKELTLSCKTHTIVVHNKIIGILVEMVDITKSQREKRWLDTNNQLLEAELEIQTEKIQKIQGSIITGMARMVESRDNSTGGHINRTSAGVRCFIEYIADNYAFPWCTTDFCVKIIEAAPLHDLGKIAVNDVILRKEGKFTPEEFEEMKKHPEEGAKIVPDVLSEVEDEEFKTIAQNVAHYHHEKWNGQGYPCGLKGDEIPIEARIMAFADVFDALVSRRCYKDAFSYDNAFDIIRDSLGTQFDPELGEIFLKCRPQLEEVYNKFDLK